MKTAFEKTIEAGTWTLRPATLSILGSFGEFQIPAKLCRILECLLTHTGHIVSRDDLFEWVWGETLVSDDALNRYISDLRKLLGRYPNPNLRLETIRGVGYRLNIDPPKELNRPIRKPHIFWPRYRAGMIVLLSCTLLLATAVFLGESPPQKSDSWRLRPLTSMVGIEAEPALSPDGTHFAFSQSPPDEKAIPALRVQALNSQSATPMMLTHKNRNASWSPVDQRMAFWQSDGDEVRLIVHDPKNQTKRALYKTQEILTRSPITWSPDGKRLAFSERTFGSSAARLCEVEVATGLVRVLTRPKSTLAGDFFPQYAPDGTSIAFIRGQRPQTLTAGMMPVIGNIYSLDFAGDEIRRHSNENLIITGFNWVAHSGEMVVLATRPEEGFGLFRLNGKGNYQELVEIPKFAAYLTSNRAGSHFAFEMWEGRTNLTMWSLEAGSQIENLALPASTRWDWSPRFDPSGTRIVFLSNRTGPVSLWIYTLATRELKQLPLPKFTDIKDVRWSPCGKWFVFSACKNDFYQIWVVDDQGAQARQVTQIGADHVASSFYQGSDHLLFSSNRSGRWEIWQMPVAGGDIQQWTVGGGTSALANPDSVGREIYITKPESPGIWRIDNPGAYPVQIADDFMPGNRGNWDIRKGAIFYVAKEESGDFLVKGYRIADEQFENKAPLRGFFMIDLPCLSFSPDGTTMVGTSLIEKNADLYLATKIEP